MSANEIGFLYMMGILLVALCGYLSWKSREQEKPSLAIIYLSGSILSGVGSAVIGLVIALLVIDKVFA